MTTSRAYKTAYAKAWRAANPDLVKANALACRLRETPEQKARKAASQKAWAAANKDRVKAAGQEWYAANRDRVAEKNLQDNYGISVADYESALVAQGCGCAICGSLEPGKGERFAVDHDHSCCPSKISCGKCVRGLLCVHCNVGLGHFRESQELLARASRYLAHNYSISDGR